MSETLGRGTSSNINISTAKLSMQNGTTIGSKTFSPAPSGNINIQATDSVQMRGLSPKTRAYNVIGSITFFTSGSQNKPITTAKAGDVTISTSNLLMQNASYISGLSFGDSVGGDITINTDTAEITGSERNLAGNMSLATTISGVSYSRGNSGKVTFNTRELALRDRGMITTSSLGTSNAGDITINAAEKVQLEGFATNISSTVGTSDPSIQAISFYRAVGNGGNLTINTPLLSVSNRAALSVQNFGTGDAGTITINSDFVQLNNQARITAATKNGITGNIDLRANNLQLRNNSLISTNTDGTGNGGNITINSDTITQLENSDITANAKQGQGGNINITTQGLFASPDSNITATGIKNGIVNVTILGINQQSSLQKQSSNFVSTDNIIASSCLASRNAEQGTFVVTGNGGLAETPDDKLDLPYELVQVQPINSYSAANSIKQASTSWKIGDPVVEAQSLQVVDGRVLLTAASVGEKLPQTSDLTCE
jgi:large exoprotein involved in heme utilization and adhesion